MKQRVKAKAIHHRRIIQSDFIPPEDLLLLLFTGNNEPFIALMQFKAQMVANVLSDHWVPDTSHF